MSVLDDLLARATPPLSADQEAEALGCVQEPSSPPAASAAAWDLLLASHARAIRRASRVVTDLDREDAEAEALAAFCAVVRTLDPTTVEEGPRLVAHALPAMERAVIDYARLAGNPVEIPGSVAARYWRLLDAAGGDIHIAYNLARAGGYGISPATLLAARQALTGPEAVEPGLTPRSGPGEVDAQSVADLLAGLSSEQAAAVEVAYGFDAEAVTALREQGALVAGNGSAVMSDRCVGQVLGLPRSTAARHRGSGLARCRATLARAVETDAAAA